jgi:hypothetical protein
MRTKETIAGLITWWTITVGVTVVVATRAVLAIAGLSEFHWLWILLPAILWAFGLLATEKEDYSFFKAVLRLTRIKAASAFSIIRVSISRAVRGLSALFTDHHIQTEP